MTTVLPLKQATTVCHNTPNCISDAIRAFSPLPRTLSHLDRFISTVFCAFSLSIFRRRFAEWQTLSLLLLLLLMAQ